MSNLQSVTQFISQRQALINTVIVVLLAIYLIAYTAELTWRIVPAPENSGAAQTSSVNVNSTQTSARVNIARIKQLNLFGQFTPPSQAETQETVTDAPETNLNLTLTGVVASSIENEGAAVIENRGDQLTYGIGDKIEGTNASLREVFRDRVIIRNGPQNETLMLDGIDFDEANKRRQRQQTTRQPEQRNPREASRLSPDAVEATHQLRDQPASFTDFISVSPAQADGQLLGYRLQPGKNPALFQAAGLVAGDIITEINGLNVTDPQQATEALGELRSAETLQLTVLRDNEYLTLYLDLPEPGIDE
ncbi:type II secretion system protein GspC [Alteromonas oceanisediminis]|uniref:type II secretion system protein GspC n=1 Tax=Alteromonas oceanisediminis TaxID=2836180 RepID=UPI001BD98B2C|nr:type II secretion system protein GspC [Alteromonas oceanisediminis]MBT0587851.1 type II secretion system protein GspC [Alteromonas oceanisediminis]